MTVKPGMTTTEVEASLGPPPMTGGGDNPDQPARWFYLPTEGDEETITTIVFLRGKVTEVERKPMKRN
jgi:outer membrane protein assembly factor BamE (lipoprotein component of BamABCDE complex)